MLNNCILDELAKLPKQEPEPESNENRIFPGIFTIPILLFKPNRTRDYLNQTEWTLQENM